MGVVAGFRADADMRRIGRPLGLVLSVLSVGGVVVVYSVLVMRGCGD